MKDVAAINRVSQGDKFEEGVFTKRSEVAGLGDSRRG